MPMLALRYRERERERERETGIPIVYRQTTQPNDNSNKINESKGFFVELIPTTNHHQLQRYCATNQMKTKFTNFVLKRMS